MTAELDELVFSYSLGIFEPDKPFMEAVPCVVLRSRLTLWLPLLGCRRLPGSSRRRSRTESVNATESSR